MRGQRKYLSEFAVNLFSARWLMTPSNQVASGGTMGPVEREISDNCHIYLIAQHPAVSFDKDSFAYRNGYIEGTINYRVQGELRKIGFRSEFPLLEGAVEVRLSPYPHREIHTLDSKGEIIRYLPASSLCLEIEASRANPEIRHFEVLYVGQAYAEGRRSAFERLKSHSTLQKILAEAQYNAPDNEIILFMFEYAPYRIISQMDGRAFGVIADERDSNRFYSILENPLTKAQQVCLTEAALIRYFSPKYNEIYKESFPSPSHKILQQCYELDFSGLIVEINTDDFEFYLYSERVAPSVHHISSIDLLGHENRIGFFHMVHGAETFSTMPNVIS
jgi:hypothetical protein